jgi:hypothetical protein
MKKKKTTTRTTPKNAVSKAVKKTNSGEQPILIHRIFIISACLTLFAFGVFYANKQTVEKSVAGASIMKGLYVQGTIPVPADLADAYSYNIYYKQTDEKEFTNAVRNVPTNVGTYTISHLKKGSAYQYRLAALDANGKEFMFFEPLPITELHPM